MPRKNLGRRRAEFREPTINLTPLIDVVFVVLIMFIVIAPLLESDRVELAEGAHQGRTSVQEESPLAIHVHKDSSIWYQKRRVSLEELKRLLAQEQQRHPLYHPQLFCDKGAPFGTYQSIKNSVEAAGFSHMDVVLKPS